MATVAEALTMAVGNVQAGHLAQGEDICRRILEVEPEHPDALHILGVIAQQVGRNDIAAEMFARALGRRPDFAEALYNLGLVLQSLGRNDEAVVAYDKAIGLMPGWAEARNNRANALKTLGRMEDAVAGYRDALAVDPDYADTHYNLGIALQELWRLDQAIACFEKTLALAPGHAPAHTALGQTLFQQNRTAEALGRFDAAIALRPDLAEARVNRALSLFLNGDLREGWEEYEWRWKGEKSYGYRPFPQPVWDGSPIRGREVLVWGEQGLADEVLAAGMLPQAMKAAGHCVVECDPRLRTLFARSFPAATVVGRGNPPDPRTLAADRQIAAFGLGRHFRPTLADFPEHEGYLSPDPAQVAHWKRWLDGLGPGLKVGVSWKSRVRDWERSRHFAPLDRLPIVLGRPGLVFVALQYDDIENDIKALRARCGVHVHTPHGLDLTDDIDGAAALTVALDAVVGPATAVSYLAGAVGTPTWMYAYYPASNEKEVFNCDRVPWCPSIRLETCGFREDWSGALTRIANSVQAFAADPARDRA